MTQSATVKRYRLSLKDGVVEDDGSHDYWPATTSVSMVPATAYDALAAQLSACQARVEEAEKDARRLDWMLTNEGSMHISGNAAYGYRVCDVSNGLVFVTGKFPTAREAIDAALGADGGGTKT